MTKEEIMNYVLTDHQKQLASALVDSCPNAAIALMAIQNYIYLEFTDEDVADMLDDTISQVANLEAERTL
jgi:hypothetical protein